ncbi:MULTISPECIES: hypothetical protein [Cyanophyceae]|uniref:hypothetical protein n=1 Tax=Cyanophyceae TaxID=3028117 RepID=UPI0016864EAB|nr:MULTISPECIES: hypothetical protein [Cyanophyceae]MBD1919039.1 hypothetical protein [Phormidium sp. FACHB-77]MBD2028968.1 hypothetical protein [Phormidium sp. FACHB-322]MBD2053973.1 hypothetical protein [Leptolyngbya sp. FACHB-60]
MAERESLFRQASLERLSSPERLDELMKLVTLKAWLPLGTLGVLLGLGLLWSIVGRVPVTTHGRGLLVQSDDSPQLVALLIFDNQYRGQLRAGMPVVLLPETLVVYNEPGIAAEVAEVVEPSALTVSQARRGEDPYAGGLEVLAHLAPMVQAMPPNTIVPGVAVEGRITLAQKPPIVFVLPFLDR